MQHITTATLVWLWTRHDLKKTFVPAVLMLLGLCVYKPFVLDFFIIMLDIGPWTTLILKAAFTLIISVASLQIYAGLAHSIGIF